MLPWSSCQGLTSLHVSIYARWDALQVGNDVGYETVGKIVGLIDGVEVMGFKVGSFVGVLGVG